jgi:hypothetical protein
VYFRCHVAKCAIAHKNSPRVSVVEYKTLVQNSSTGGGYRRPVQEAGTGGRYRRWVQEAGTGDGYKGGEYSPLSAVCALVRCISAPANVGENAALGYWAVGFKSRIGTVGARRRGKGRIDEMSLGACTVAFADSAPAPAVTCSYTR